MTIKTEPKLLRRTLSTFIDYGLYLIFYVWFLMTFGIQNEEGQYEIKNDSVGLIVLVVWFIYFPIIESIKGQTLGKLIMKLRVVTKSRNQISFGQAIKRHLVDMLDFFFFGLVAIIAIKNTPDHQRLGDLWAKTIVIGEDNFNCSNCRDTLTLTVDEIMKKEFVCPTCGTKNKI